MTKTSSTTLLELTEAELDAVSAGALVDVVIVAPDAVDVNNNRILTDNNIPVTVGANVLTSNSQVNQAGELVTGRR